MERVPRKYAKVEAELACSARARRYISLFPHRSATPAARDSGLTDDDLADTFHAGAQVRRPPICPGRTRLIISLCFSPQQQRFPARKLSADLCSAAIPLLGTPGWRFPLDGPRAGARIASQCGGEPDEFRLIQVMKTLFLIRHAKSSWHDTALPDKDRPLGDRGRRDAPKMGKRLAKRDVKPDLILSSPARRALTTAEIIAKKLDYKLKDIVVDDRLYAAAMNDLFDVIHQLGDKLERVMLFGHNPELTEFAHRLSGEITHMPTCAVAEFTFSAKSWRNIGKANLARVALDYPKKRKS